MEPTLATLLSLCSMGPSPIQDCPLHLEECAMRECPRI